MLRRERGLSYKQLERRSAIAASTLQYWMTRSVRLMAWVQVRAVVVALDEPEEVWFDRWKWTDRESTRNGRPDTDAAPGASRAGHRVADGPRSAANSVLARSQLPMDIREFTGRAAELRRMYDALAPAEGRMAVPVLVITGMAGVGKTRLAIHVAHQLKRHFRFGDIQLYADLRGNSTSRPAADPAAVLEAFLHLLGVPTRDMPRDLEARAALFRDRLDGRRAIVLLDNAAGEEQVRPLLPGSATCRVLVTSRRGLAGLDGAQPVILKAFTPTEAVAQLSEVIGEHRVAAEPEVAAEIVRRCGYLPLAVALAARRLQARPAWTLADFANRLRPGADRLGELAVSGRAVRTTFGLSYGRISAAQRRTFRFLGLHPGLDFTPRTTAVLTDTTPEAAEDQLEQLLDEHLLDQATAGRYLFHDLVRTYARECVDEDEPADGRAAAMRRMHTWYLHAADRASHLLAPRLCRFTLDPARAPRWTPNFATHQEALDWCDAEHLNLTATVRQAIDHGQDDTAWRLAASMLYFFTVRRHWDEWIRTYEAAVGAARRAGSELGEAKLLDGLAMAYRDVGRFPESLNGFRKSLEIYRRVGDRLGEAQTQGNLGEAYRHLGRFDAAVNAIQRSLTTFRELDDRRHRIVGVNNLGKTYRAQGRLEEGLDCHLRAWDLCEQDGIDHHTAASILNDLGEIHLSLGRSDRAIDYYRETLSRRRTLGDRHGEAETLRDLGRCYQAEARADTAPTATSRPR